MGSCPDATAPVSRPKKAATKDIDDDGRQWEAQKRPVLMYESIDAVTRHSAEGASKSNRYPDEHADLRSDRTI
jgi:hypothetical protein